MKKNSWFFLTGFILSLEHLTTVMVWFTEKPLRWYFSAHDAGICPPIFSACEFLRFNSAQVPFYIGFYLIVILVTAFSWARQHEKAGLIGLGILLVLRLLPSLMDYRLQAGDFYLASLLTFGFIVWRQSASLILPLIAALFLVFVGVQSLSTLPFAFLGLLLISRNKYVFGLSLVLISLLQMYLWNKFGFAYSISLLVVLGALISASLSENANSKFSVIFQKPGFLAFIFVFILVQSAPALITGDSAITAEGRYFSVASLSAEHECQPFVKIWKTDQSDDVALQPPLLNDRNKCDIVIYWRLAEQLCHWSKNNSDIHQIDLNLVSKSPDSEWKPIVNFTDFCRQKVPFSVLFPNTWINRL